MRTTVRLPQDLYDEVRETALRERRTVTSLIEEALRGALASRRSPATDRPVAIRTVRTGPLRPGVDLARGDELLDLMDGLDAGA
ncbi:MAG: DUF2191 domain-containing protein [Acidobacteria bacterium]|nr:MAG: DUF2191 domain-containing protein [Acidobacteriota bacterium]